MKVAIIGRTQILYETARKLHEAGHQICCVITSKAAPEYTRSEEDFRQLAAQLGATFILTNNLDRPDVVSACSGLDIGISLNWVSVVGKTTIDLFGLGILNAHHGDLPRHRGNACANWALINGEEKIANTIHFMEDGKLDCGRVVCQLQYEVNDETTITEVYRWTEDSTPDLYLHALQLLSDDRNYTLKFADADGDDSFRCYPRLPEDGYIDWQWDALRIHRLIRAVCEPFSGAYTYHWAKGEAKKLVILKSQVVQVKTNDLAMPGHVLKNDAATGASLVHCGEGVLGLLRCRYEDEDVEFEPGKKWGSIRMRLGIRAEDWLWQMRKSKKF